MTALKILCGLTLLAFASCKSDPPEDLTNAVKKDGSVESAIAVTPLDSSRNLLTTTHKVWLHDTVYKTLQYTDTVPALGKTTSTAENSDGDTKTVTVDKEYEIYITIK